MLRLDRRQVLGLGLAAWAAQAPRPPIITEPGVESFRLTEPGGLARIAEPVSTRLPLIRRGGPFRLTRDGRAVPAQFRADPGPDGPYVVLDFVADLAPRETARYEVHHGLGIGAGPEPEPGLAVAMTPTTFVIQRNREAAFEVDRGLKGLLLAVGSKRVAWLGDPSPGALVTLAGGQTIRPGDATTPHLSSEVVRKGPAALALRFAWSLVEGLKVEWSLTFPASRNRVVVEAHASDATSRVEAMGFDLNLRLGPDLVTIERDPAEPAAWVRAIEPRRQVLMVVEPSPPESGRDQVQITPEGRLAVTRRFASRTANPMLRATIEFASDSTPFATRPSPLALLQPVRVEWDRPPETLERK